MVMDMASRTERYLEVKIIVEHNALRSRFREHTAINNLLVYENLPPFGSLFFVDPVRLEPVLCRY